MPQDRPLAAGQPKAAPKDWGQAGWGDVLLHGLATAPEAFGSDVASTAKGLASAGFHGARQVAGLEPTTPGLDRIVVSGLRGMTGQPMYGPKAVTPTAADAPAAVHDALQTARGLKNYAVSRYGSMPAFKRTVATDMPGVAMDVGAVASIPEGGEGLVGRTGVAGAVANPVGAAMRTIRGGPILDRAGAFTPKVVDAMEAAAPGSSRELSNPAFRNHVVQTMGQKGISTPAAREAIVSYHAPQSPVSRATTLGVEPPPRVQDLHNGLVANNQMAIGQKMQAGPALDAPAMLATDPAGKFTNPTQAIRDYTLSPEGAGVFAPQDASDVRIATHGQDILNAPLAPNTAAGWGQAVRGTAGAVAGIGAGVLAGHAAPMLGQYIPELIGGALGVPIEHKLIEPGVGVVQRQLGKAGAPGAASRFVGPASDVVSAAAHTSPLFNPHTGAPPVAPTPATAAPADTSPGYTPFTPQPLDSGEPETTPAPENAPSAAPEPAHGHVHDRPLSADPGGGSYQPYAPTPLDDGPPAAQAAGGRVERADGGHVASMVDRLMSRADREGKATRSATKPLLGLDDTTVAKALAIAGRAI